MKHKIDVKEQILVNPMQAVNRLGAELVIEAALRHHRKAELEQLIDKALLNKNEADFMMYTNEYNELEAQNIV
ncbi:MULTISPECIES: IDEAL domain-containing protein [unclassified Staphylococcus]|uniref:IDEAL domain-containing protein n=1 Tax=unclassified Staphylococcus TaxID=91994 RepID=UPI0021D26272|nr:MULTISPECIES: IDEAL domain-containing protein [unclassified Staphylococcus]UXR78909.1 IDEAL domain-containing protein [Staphylococcus sp. IVB6227]UXR83070.1 IDEAL domain-containing protein [Staphylococcus sp. IVB6214]